MSNLTSKAVDGYTFDVRLKLNSTKTLSFGKNQFNLAKRLKAAQVHDSDTPSPFSQRLGGGVGSKSLNI